jgi:hypothetical protein
MASAHICIVTYCMVSELGSHAQFVVNHNLKQSFNTMSYVLIRSLSAIPLAGYITTTILVTNMDTLDF